MNRKTPRRYRDNTVAVLGLTLMGTMLIGYYFITLTVDGRDAARAETRKVHSSLKAATDVIEKQGSEIDGLRQNNRALEASLTILASQLTSATSTIDALTDDLDDALRPKPLAAPKKQTALTVSYSPEVWSRAQVVSTIKAQAIAQGVPTDKAAWLAEKGADIAYRESRYNTKATNGQHLGLFQFNDGWGDSAGRLDGTTSCAKFVRVYVTGGESALRRHWAATW